VPARKDDGAELHATKNSACTNRVRVAWFTADYAGYAITITTTAQSDVTSHTDSQMPATPRHPC